ncbi:hypothetical protein BH23CHL4_BH23CHL4_17870 [soil metagenome]
MADCQASRTQLPQGFEALRIENDHISLTVLPERGADLYEWVHKPTGIDVLWKSPWGLGRHRGNPSTSTTTASAWIEAYEGGWQVLFPSGGGPSLYKGVELNFHGEASVSAWDVEDFGMASAGAGMRLSNRLARSPFRISREIYLKPGDSHFQLRETVTNEGGEPVDYMWGHHPAYGAPLIGELCRIDTNAASITADDLNDGPGNPMDLGATFSWPSAQRDGAGNDLSIVPGEDAERATLGYLHDFANETAWYGLTNTARGVGAGLAWQRAELPCAWFWQELHATPGFPWYKGVYVMAIEPNTSYPGQGLVAMSAKTGMQRTLLPGESASLEIRAVLYESNTGIEGITLDGAVKRRQEH